MVWEDHDFKTYYRQLLNDVDAKRGIAAQQIVQRFHAEVGRLGGVSGVHVATMIAEYEGKTIAEVVSSRVASFEAACKAINVEPDVEDYTKLLSEIEPTVDRALTSAKQHLQQELLHDRGALNLIPSIEQIAARTKAEDRRLIDLRKIETRRRTPHPGSSGSPIFISHIAEDAELAAALKDHLKAALGDDLQVFVSSDYDSIRSGADWHGVILETLKKSRVILVLISEESARRPWINYEAGVGDGIGAEVIPIAIRGFSKGDLRQPLARHHARTLYSAEEVAALLKDVGLSTKRTVCSTDVDNLVREGCRKDESEEAGFSKEEAAILVAASMDGKILLHNSELDSARFRSSVAYPALRMDACSLEIE